MEENLDSFPSDADNAFIHPTTAWDEDCLTQLPETRICIVMMECGNGMDHLAKPDILN
jgi:hypothetical protein